MLSKCANPACSKPFRYLRDGKLFEFDYHRNAEAKESTTLAPRRLEFFWLCGECAGELTVIHDRQKGVVTVPIAQEAKFLVRGAAA